MKKLLTVASFASLVACNSTSSKLFIVSNGSLDNSSTAKDIKIKEGTSYVEKEYTVTEKNIKATVGSSSSSTSLDGDGYFLWNLKKDTLVGAKQNVGSAERGTVTITQEMLQQKIDSLVALTENRNVNAKNNNFFVLPGQSVKLTSSSNVYIAGPFHSLPRQLDETKYNASTEVFKFYTVKELREEIERLKGMTK
jgi:hypothetical protein